MKLVYLRSMQNKKTGEYGVVFTSIYGQSSTEIRLDIDGYSAEDLYWCVPMHAPYLEYGKLNFPTRDCAPYLCPGPAEVEVVTTKENYNFFSGRMLQFAMPSDEKLCEYIYDEHFEDAEDVTFTRKVGGIRGDYIIVTKNGNDFMLVGEGLIRLHDIVHVNDGAKTTEVVNGRDFLCRAKQGCDFATLADKFRNEFVNYEYDNQYRRLPISYVYEPRLVDWIESGIVTVYVHTHRKTTVHTAEVRSEDLDVLVAAKNFSPNEIDEMLEIVNRINAEANATTKAFIERKIH